MTEKLNRKKIIKEIKNNGFYILDNYLSNQDIDKIKKSLLKVLHYIKPDNENNLQKKYYQIKKYNSKLKGNWYDLATRDINLLQFLHAPVLIDLVKEYFNTEVVFSGRACIHVHDDDNEKLLDPHQETSQLSRDSIALWAPLYDTNTNNGGIAVFKDSHKHGYFDHTLEHPRLSPDKSWTKQYTHVDPSIAKRFEKIELEVKAGSALLMHSSVLHCGYPNKTKGSVRIILCERFNPLQKIPFLRNVNAPMKIPFVGVDYNAILD